MTLNIEPLHPLIGARLSGVDLSQALAADTFPKVREALHRHQVLVFPGQELTQRHLLNFAERFGRPEVFPDPTERIGEVPHVLRLTNLNDGNQPSGPSPRMARMSLAENWHSDSSYRRVPSYVTFLHGVETPAAGGGGDTDFTSLHSAYEALPEDLRTRIEPLSAVHNWEYQRTLSPGRQPMTEEERASTPPVRHRLVQRHPDTGRKLLFISSSAEYIDGLARAEGRELLNELTRIATQPQLVYTHRWTVNDLVMWDNRATLHRAAGFDYQSLTLRRLLHRVVIAGDAAAYAGKEKAQEAAA